MEKEPTVVSIKKLSAFVDKIVSARAASALMDDIVCEFNGREAVFWTRVWPHSSLLTAIRCAMARIDERLGLPKQGERNSVVCGGKAEMRLREEMRQLDLIPTRMLPHKIEIYGASVDLDNSLHPEEIIIRRRRRTVADRKEAEGE